MPREEFVYLEFDDSEIPDWEPALMADSHSNQITPNERTTAMPNLNSYNGRINPDTFAGRRVLYEALDGLFVIPDEIYEALCTDGECCQRSLYRSESQQSRAVRDGIIAAGSPGDGLNAVTHAAIRRNARPTTEVTINASEWKRNKLYTHTDQTTCAYRFLGLYCGRRHTVSNSDERLSLYVNGQELLEDSVQYVGNHWSGRPLLRGHWGRYGDYATHYADENVTIGIGPLRCVNYDYWCSTYINGPTDGYTINGNLYCHSCATLCTCHREPHTLRGANGEESELVNAAGGYYCRGSEPHCAVCNESLAGRRWFTVARQQTCNNCYWRCDECGERYLVQVGQPRRCPRAACDPRGRILGYRHTAAVQWLGKPDTEENGVPYFLGFELEVSADRRKRYPGITDWAEAHLQDEFSLEMKTDASVAGFEIVSQPMTPEYFESVEWESFFTVLNRDLPVTGDTEPTAHGLHVHIGRVAFDYNPVATAAFCYLLASNHAHLERIARREATGYCTRVPKPVSETLVSHSSYSGHTFAKDTRQTRKVRSKGIGITRGAINLLNQHTVEIRAGRSTRNADELRDYVRLVYVAAEYVRHLMRTNVSIPPKALNWDAFAKWTGDNYPVAFPSISNTK